MHYDQTFKAVFGGDSLNAMRRVTAQAQNVYYWPTLPTIVTLSVVAEQEIPNSINADQPSMWVDKSTIQSENKQKIYPSAIFEWKR